ncbi:MAG TPA: DegT/DnrJ/EryC1/StrS family aminotransferase [Candidatus Binatia bacterium]|nr:DegT/DnrJ/EryC1/StrS family aminotransferase [Candidatus Binatia bacterium]
MATKIPLLDLKREHAAIGAEIHHLWAEMLEGMHLLKGPHGTAFEEEIADFIGTTQAVGVSSGTDALALGLAGLTIGAGDEVILHANGFTADVEAIRAVGAQPVLVDVAEGGLGPDPEAVVAAITPRTRALMVVHLYGSPLPLAPLLDITRRHHVALVEDASHAHGAARDGVRVGSYGAAGCFSCGVVKNLGAYGDAGFITTNDGEVAHRVRLYQTHGQEKKNHHVLYGGNYRLDEVQAAVLRVKLRSLESRNARRAKIAAHYSARFAPLGIGVPVEAPNEVHVYHQYVIRTPRRDALSAFLKQTDIETGVHYPVPLHRQPAWLRAYGETPNFPRAEKLTSEILSLPVFPDLTDAEVERVADAVVAFFRQ